MFCVILIQFNFSLLFSFLLGIGVGISIFALVYLILFLSSINKKKYVSSVNSNEVSDEEVKQIIEETIIVAIAKSITKM